ncbi:hypothetical protein BIT28_25070 [Photobacterium proteolyticum]|uniref:Uncharacterized protein n=1 Tax=Photobacterium proteolyticum TaxID=1903952 RepID=A0A1Q9GD12_9GAMM|nr:hypothetical protein [Photobacterium proteolyticum]OLQ72287.1 hypothetical protein BIT28_25070 [Photobacterium proteolyticum]
MRKLILFVFIYSLFGCSESDNEKLYEIGELQSHAIENLIKFHPELEKQDLLVMRINRVINLQTHPHEPDEYLLVSIYDTKNLMSVKNSEWSSLIKEFGEDLKGVNEYKVRYRVRNPKKLDLNGDFDGFSTTTLPLFGVLREQLENKIDSNK